MLNRFKKIAPSALSAFRSMSSTIKVDSNGYTNLHYKLPSIKSIDELYQYINEQGCPHFERELHTVSNSGMLPIAPLAINSPIYKECLKFYNQSGGMLPLNEPANSEPNPNEHHYADYLNLFKAANTITDYARRKLKQSPHPFWMDPNSPEAKAIHQNEEALEIDLDFTLLSQHQKDYIFHFADLAEEHGSGTSKAFACVALKALAHINRFGPLEGSVYSVGRNGENHHLLIINDIFFPTHAVVCDPWQGKAYTTADINSQCRIPLILDGNPQNTALVYCNPYYHVLRPSYHAPIHAGERTSYAYNPSRLFHQISYKLKNNLDKRREDAIFRHFTPK